MRTGMMALAVGLLAPRFYAGITAGLVVVLLPVVAFDGAAVSQLSSGVFAVRLHLGLRRCAVGAE